MGKIYAYHRFSTDEQDAQSQRNIISKYVEAKGLQIDEIISDEGISGSVSYRKRNLSELLKKTKPGDTKAALDAKKKKIEEEGGFISKSGNWCTSLGGTTSGQAKGGKVNGEKRRKEAMENSTNRIIATLLADCVTPQDVDKVADKLNAMGLKTSSGLVFTRNRLTALRTKINRRTEYAQSVL